MQREPLGWAFLARGLRGGDVIGGGNAVLRIIGTQVCNRGNIPDRPGALCGAATFLINPEIKTVSTR
jgi:hypothetical protein